MVTTNSRGALGFLFPVSKSASAMSETADIRRGASNAGSLLLLRSRWLARVLLALFASFQETLFGCFDIFDEREWTVFFPFEGMPNL